MPFGEGHLSRCLWVLAFYATRAYEVCTTAFMGFLLGRGYLQSVRQSRHRESDDDEEEYEDA